VAPAHRRRLVALAFPFLLATSCLSFPSSDEPTVSARILNNCSTLIGASIRGPQGEELAGSVTVGPRQDTYVHVPTRMVDSLPYVVLELTDERGSSFLTLKELTLRTPATEVIVAGECIHGSVCESTSTQRWQCRRPNATQLLDYARPSETQGGTAGELAGLVHQAWAGAGT